MFENFGYFEYAVIAIAAIGSAVIKNGAGVGAGIFMLPFLSLVLPAKFALGLGAPIMLISDVAGVMYYWKEWDKKELFLLLPPAFLGVMLGALTIKAIPSDLFRFWIGFLAIIFSSYQLLKLKMSKEKASGKCTNGVSTPKNALSIFFGFLGGIASSVIHAGGLVMSVYLIHKSKDKRVFVGTLVLFFAAINLMKVIVYVNIKILTSEILILTAIMSPLIILGGFWGNALNKRVSQKTFRAIVFAVILLIGVNLLMEM